MKSAVLALKALIEDANERRQRLTSQEATLMARLKENLHAQAECEALSEELQKAERLVTAATA